MPKTLQHTNKSTHQDKRQDFLLEDTAKQFIHRFDIEHAFPPGDRPKRKVGLLKRIFSWFKGK